MRVFPSTTTLAAAAAAEARAATAARESTGRGKTWASRERLQVDGGEAPASLTPSRARRKRARR